MASSITGAIGASNASSAAGKASAQQVAADQNGINTQNNAQTYINSILQPYLNSGTSALTSQENLLGLNGNGAQSTAIQAVQNGSEYQGLKQQGENAILQNASATGGLRGGNTEGALAQFSPQLLQTLIQQQYSNLAGMSGQGLNATNTGAQTTQNTADNVSNLQVGQGAAQAGGTLGQAQAYNQMLSALSGGLGVAGGIGANTSTGAGLIKAAMAF